MRGFAVALLCAAVAAASSFHGKSASFRSFKHAASSRSLPGRPSSANCTTHWHTQTLDHFGWAAGPNNQTTFQQRVLFCSVPDVTPVEGACPPVLFYTGNEGDVELYVNETGLMWEHAASLGVEQLVFAEHRFFGKTLPFGEDFPMDSVHMNYLSVSQALADYASIIYDLRDNVWGCRAPVVAVGGSYGGMLASWLRIKYPSAVDGAVAGSAPIWAFEGEQPALEDGYFAQIETYDASEEGLGSESCVDAIRDSFSAINRLAPSAPGRATLSKAVGLCEAANTTAEAYSVAWWASNGFSFLAMGSYPYPSSYMLNGNGFLPPYPMADVCRRMEPAFGTSSDEVLLTAFGRAIGVWFNYTQDQPCFDWTAGAPNKQTEIDGMLWDYLACTTMVMPMSQNGKTDMFWNAPWDGPAYARGCEERWGVSPRPLWATISFGGKNLRSASNLFFSSGELDPWRGADVNVTAGSVVSAVVSRGGHHMDLMFAQPEDNQTNVAQVRKMEVQHMASWISEAYESRRGVAAA